MKYAVRSLKYFFALCVLCVALMALMLLTGTSALSLEDTLYAMLHTDRYALLLGAIVVLAVFYPKFGFTKRRVRCDRGVVMNAMRSAGYSLRSEADGAMRFRADSPLRRALMLFEDEVCVHAAGEWMVLDGNRRSVARVVFSLDAYTRYTQNDD